MGQTLVVLGIATMILPYAIAYFVARRVGRNALARSQPFLMSFLFAAAAYLVIGRIATILIMLVSIFIPGVGPFIIFTALSFGSPFAIVQLATHPVLMAVLYFVMRRAARAPAPAATRPALAPPSTAMNVAQYLVIAIGALIFAQLVLGAFETVTSGIYPDRFDDSYYDDTYVI